MSTNIGIQPCVQWSVVGGKIQCIILITLIIGCKNRQCYNVFLYWCEKIFLVVLITSNPHDLWLWCLAPHPCPHSSSIRERKKQLRGLRASSVLQCQFRSYSRKRAMDPSGPWMVSIWIIWMCITEGRNEISFGGYRIESFSSFSRVPLLLSLRSHIRNALTEICIQLSAFSCYPQSSCASEA